jgi:hypothetical protein
MMKYTLWQHCMGESPDTGPSEKMMHHLHCIYNHKRRQLGQASEISGDAELHFDRWHACLAMWWWIPEVVSDDDFWCRRHVPVGAMFKFAVQLQPLVTTVNGGPSNGG